MAAAGAGYQIKVISADSVYSDFSDRKFTIRASGE